MRSGGGVGQPVCGRFDASPRTWVLRGVVLREALVLEHMQQRRLASVVKAEEENLGILVGQACSTQQPCRRRDAVSGST